MNKALKRLSKFRKEIYHLLGSAKDSTFELMDAVITTKNVDSLAELSLSPLFRRKWSSIYEAIQDCRPNRNKLMKCYLHQMPTEPRIILAGDHTPFPRTEAPTLKDRTYEHGAKVISGKPITLGHGYSTLAWIPEKKGSWALPLRHERITSFETPLTKATFQLKQVCKYLKKRPISMWDSEYGCAPFVKMTADIPADKLMRLRPNRCLFGSPPEYQGNGRPKKHGTKMKLSDPTTWEESVQSITINEDNGNEVEIQRWSQYHFYQSADHPMEIIRIQRKGNGISQSDRKPMWLAWIGQEMPSLFEIWLLYLRRFAIEHWNRFAKQRLHWTKGKWGTPKKEEKWSDLMPILTWQLWLAREIVEDNPLPWQKPQPPEKITPGRVAQSFLALLIEIGTPAKSPKPRGKSPGWEKGKKRNKRPRYPVVKKTVSRSKKRTNKAA